MTGADPANPIPGRFASLLGAAPDAPMFLGSDAVCTRAQVDRLARGIEALLTAAPVPGVCALAAANGPAFLAAALAAWRRGLAVLLIDAAVPAAGRLQLASRFGAAVLLQCDEPWPRDAGAVAVQTLRGARALPGVHAILLTSGSTGAPRGIATTGAALLADGEAIGGAMGLTAEDRVAAAVPMSFAYGLGAVTMPALALGVPLVLPAPGHPFNMLVAVRTCAATALPTVPVFVQTLLQSGVDLPVSLRIVLTAGAPLRSATALAFAARFGRPVQVLYGSSECGGISHDRSGEAAQRGTVGRPLPDVGVRILADDVLEVSSPRVAACYLQEPDERLRGGRFVTGDRARIVGGELQLLGRVHELIETGGRKYHPREVEEVLARMPGVDDVVVDAARGKGRCRAVIACGQGELTRAEVMAWCSRHLPPFKLPRSVSFVTEIPRNGRGKIDAAGTAPP